MQKDIKIGLFAYNFPHQKTQDFIFRLLTEGYKIDVILAADAVKLNIPPSVVKTKIRHQGLIHPGEIAKRFNIPYYVVKHNSKEAISIANERSLDIGIIAGARILKSGIINSFNKGIINYHPGLIPEARGLDAMLWSIRNGIPLGITSHLINEEIDAGKILKVFKIPIYKDDTVFDLSERLYEYQLEMLNTSIQMAIEGEGSIPPEMGECNTKMEGELEIDTLQMLPSYIIEQLAAPKIVIE